VPLPRKACAVGDVDEADGEELAGSIVRATTAVGDACERMLRVAARVPRIALSAAGRTLKLAFDRQTDLFQWLDRRVIGLVDRAESALR
jgi:hypothetical protein